MKRNVLLLIGLLSVGLVFGQILTLSQTEVNFGQVNINTESFVDIDVTNVSNEEVTINIVENSDILEINQNIMNLLPEAVGTIHITVSPETNIVYDNTIFFNVAAEEYSLPLKINVGGRIPDSRYNGTYNKWDSELKTALTSIISGHTSISYEDARVELFGYIANESGQVRCVYTNQWYSCSPGGTPNWDIMNTEHTWPQSMGAEGTAKSDLHHLFPTNSQANSTRGNYPFGVVENASWQSGGSKKGSDLGGNTVFEPRDDHKGDTARAMFYFSLRYNNPNNFLNSANQQMVLRDWYYADPVSDYEIDRNEEIKDIQNKPNPFIEYPMLLDRIANLTHNVTSPRYAQIYVPFSGYNFPATALNQTTTIAIPISNTGDSNLSISSVSVSNSAMQIIDYPNTLEVGDWGLIELSFTPSQETSYSGVIEINSNTSLFTINIAGNGGGTSNSNDVTVCNNLVSSTYPNPFNDQTKLNIHGIKQQDLTVNIYNVKGQLVKMLTSFEINGGNSELIWNARDEKGKKLASGLYFAKITSGNQSITQKMLIIK